MTGLPRDGVGVPVPKPAELLVDEGRGRRANRRQPGACDGWVIFTCPRVKRLVPLRSRSDVMTLGRAVNLRTLENPYVRPRPVWTLRERGAAGKDDQQGKPEEG
jgi:hypothetical protein